MKYGLITFLLFTSVVFTSCKDEKIVDMTNTKGEFFKQITEDNQINRVSIYESIPNAPAKISNNEFYDFPGQNFMRIGEMIDGKFYGSSFNLDRVIWYDTDEDNFGTGKTWKVLRIEFDQ